MNRPRAADDFAAIRARMEELRRERAREAKIETRGTADRGVETRGPVEKARRPATARARGFANRLDEPALRFGAISRPPARRSNAERKATTDIGDDQAVRHLPMHGRDKLGAAAMHRNHHVR